MKNEVRVKLKRQAKTHVRKGTHAAAKQMAQSNQTEKKRGQRSQAQRKVKPVEGAVRGQNTDRRQNDRRSAEDCAEKVLCQMVRVSGNFGFARPFGQDGSLPEDRSLDIFIPGKYLKGYLPGEQVQVVLSRHPRRPDTREGEIMSMARSAEQKSTAQTVEQPPCVTGTVISQFGRLWLNPDFCPGMLLRLDRDGLEKADLGQKVAAQLVYRGRDYDGHVFALQRRFGDSTTALACCNAILFENGIATEYPAKALQQAKALQVAAGRLSVESGETGGAHFSLQEKADRLDLTDKAIFTVDSDATKDMDDALDIAPLPGGGWTLGVHIADVSHYVRSYDALDKAALARGTSVYWADRVVPMLPPQLSNDLCSLNAGVERLAFSCLMQLDADGNVWQFRFVKTVICSRVKGVYTEINALLSDKAEQAIVEKYAPIADQLTMLQQLYLKFAAKRQVRGGMDIESGESKLTVDASGKCIGVSKRQSGESERIIEECMILANGCAARYARENRLPFLYRVHEKPTADRVDSLKTVLGALGVPYHFEKELPSQTELAELLEQTRCTPLETPVHTAILRAMTKADYRPQPLGHYGLALQDYAHFTSPIRRYPDLAIHRILSDAVARQGTTDLTRRYKGFVEYAATQSSLRERMAMKAERDCEDCYKAEYMQQFVGKLFDGVITAVTGFGFYVGLPDTVEGLVRAETLSAAPLQLQEGVSLADPLTGKIWRVGDALRVRLISVSVPLGQIDFIPE